MASTLKQKAVSGIVWTAIQKYSTIFIQFISGIVLARLLTPYDYGCIGMLTIFMTLAQTFIDGGFGSALIQKKHPTQEDYSTIFWWNMAMAVIMYTILFVSAPAIAYFYDIPLLSSVLRVLGLVLIFYAFNIIQQNQLRKKLNFKLLSIVTMVTMLISLSTTILMAYYGFGVWALVVQYIITAAIPTLVFWSIVKWRPKFTFSKNSFRSLFGFGAYMFMSSFVYSLSKETQSLIIGKVYNPTTLGYYSIARRTESVASTSISHIMIQVAYPLYAEVQDDKQALSNMIKKLIVTLAYVTFPLIFILALCAKPIFVLLYSERWLSAVPYFQMLCFAGLASCLQSVNLQSIAAIGKSRIMFLCAMLKQGVGLILIIIGLTIWGMKGLLCAVVLHQWFTYTVNVGLVSKYIGYKWWIQLKHLFPVVFASITAAICCYVICSMFSLTMYLDGILKIFIYLLVYLGWSLVFRPDAYRYFKDTIHPLFKQVKNKISKKPKQWGR